MSTPKAQQSVNILRAVKPENIREKVHVQRWRVQLEHSKLLTHLLDQTGQSQPSDRDFQVAETVVQWLGSPVGQMFLEDCGKEALLNGG